MPLVGLDNLYYAVMTKDDSTGVAYMAPVKIAGAINVKVDPKQNSATLYADNGPSETSTTLGEIAVEAEAKDIGIDDQATLLGHTVIGGVIVCKSTDSAPYVALGYKSKKSNGKYRYTWLSKGKFEEIPIDNQTQEDKPKFQTPKLKGTFIMRQYDNDWRKMADEDHVDYVPATGTNWFTAVEGVADTTPPTLTSTTPINNAVTVAVGTTYQWLFSEAILPSTVIPGNFFLVKDTDGTLVAGLLSQSPDQKTITFTPSANLAATTAYRAIATIGVKDLAGNALAAPQVNKFTTA
ncbi:MAG: major tail protein [Desulfitobacteriaceae bacterium]